jgi:GNAT superfamily N-acetyltransferase
VIRRARPDDVQAICRLVLDLATYERAAHEVRLTPETLSAALFAPEPAVHAHVAEADGEVVGFALWFVSFSTWLGRHGIYLEDLYVDPVHRGSGFGRALLGELARTAVERGYGRVEWSVLDWNTPAIGFYRSLGAHPMEDWTVYRLDGKALADLGEGPPVEQVRG